MLFVVVGSHVFVLLLIILDPVVFKAGLFNAAQDQFWIFIYLFFSEGNNEKGNHNITFLIMVRVSITFIDLKPRQSCADTHKGTHSFPCEKHSYPRNDRILTAALKLRG